MQYCKQKIVLKGEKKRAKLNYKLLPIQKGLET